VSVLVSVDGGDGCNGGVVLLDSSFVSVRAVTVCVSVGCLWTVGLSGSRRAVLLREMQCCWSGTGNNCSCPSMVFVGANDGVGSNVVLFVSSCFVDSSLVRERMYCLVEGIDGKRVSLFVVSCWCRRFACQGAKRRVRDGVGDGVGLCLLVGVNLWSIVDGQRRCNVVADGVLVRKRGACLVGNDVGDGVGSVAFRDAIRRAKTGAGFVMVNLWSVVDGQRRCACQEARCLSC